MNKISILSFIDGYKKAAEKDKYVKKHIVTTYVPYEEKVARANRIIKATSYVTVGEREIPKISSTSRYMYFMLEIVSAYTNIEIEYADGKALKSFNALNKEGFFEIIASLLPGKEYTEFETVLNMLLDDLYENEFSTYNLINQKVEALGMFINGLFPALDKLMSNEKVVNKIIASLDKVVN